jgi:nucleoside-diphosphate-sugar epimerase
LAQTVSGQDVVVHLAFIIPKMSATGIESEDQPDWAYEINVGGTRNLVECMKAQPHPPRLLFISSYHVYGLTQDQPPPRTIWDPVHPVEHYARHKVACEQMVRWSGLEWSIFRLAAALPLAIQLDPGMFDVPLDTRMEYVHSRDVALAIGHALECEEAWGKILLIGGGPRCQYTFREITHRILGAVGVGMLPDAAFGSTAFATDWMDTSESQRLLDYQRRDLGDYVRDMRRALRVKLPFIRLFRPWVRRYLLARSPHYGRTEGAAASAPAQQSLSKAGMELSPEVKQLLTETAKSLRGRARRLFMARAVRAMGSGGRQKAERELGWARKAIVAGLRDLDKMLHGGAARS